MSKLAWYWHRLRAMDPAEVALHTCKKVRQFFDARSLPNWRRWELTATNAFPSLPDPEKAPQVLRDALKRDAEDIIAGRWKAFGHLELRVDDPPKWHKDYFVDRDLATEVSAFRLDHRELPGGADIKLIWELSRWHQLVRLAMAAYVLRDGHAALKCVDWLEDWVKHNPPYRGWNWTSALEVGMRLIQFTWIDALLSRAGARTTSPARDDAVENVRVRLSALRTQILAPHVRYAWRHKSFGSSANNHLLGEFAGLIAAGARWPELSRWSVSLDMLQRLWEREVLAQFAEDGGNKEQALSYHLFSWEFCWQVRLALRFSGREISPLIEDRLRLASEFFGCVEVEKEHWDYGDSDNGTVTPFFAHAGNATSEWWGWFRGLTRGEAVAYWLGGAPEWTPRGELISKERGGTFFKSSGMAVDRWNLWFIRFDLSPLGYESTAAHGHLDALHLSVWSRGVAMVIDPGTGAYFADPVLRRFLASWDAHNGPRPIASDFPERRGPFLWAKHHPTPRTTYQDGFVQGELELPIGIVGRRLKRIASDSCWEAEDWFKPRLEFPDNRFTVRWQFAPGSWVKRQGERSFSIRRGEAAIEIQVDENWEKVELMERTGAVDTGRLARCESLEGVVSPAFREVCWAPFLKLTARPETGKSCVFRTTFLASPPA